ncbi:class I SAM-dependent methyltransferase [Candidatus Nitrosocosmicus agrestis]|uniref:class I SAM-dependent methyltransferase n=1 Tax=Candidatus Nitrosocosmicus agrestis TaxID=2563600 RepID=UPI00122E252C|nr:class I SAM-dependent methyltransferase [Candidatus Nitrosocosmicus sp. SS]KAA2279408.1 class I SAM-dependent methyltransferase [Candidatus Nitrosocosmicus sp. SS]KAF0868096.1 class I SAM-dependent methyltransferase [Candidatus Nitrosocosmicus sp. SS]
MSTTNQSKGVWALGDYKSLGRTVPPVSAKLTRLVKVDPTDSVLDVACGFGNTAITARRIGAKVTGIDITPELLSLAKEEESIAGFNDIVWEEGNAENLPFEDEIFDVVLSTFGHMFAPNQEKTAKEMLRVLKKGGRIGFTTWSPDLAMGRMFSVVSKYAPTTPTSSPVEWGNPDRVKELLTGVKELYFERDTMNFPILSPNHYWQEMSTKSGSMVQLIEAFRKSDNNEKIELLRKEYLTAVEPYIVDNAVRLGYLITIATKE